MLSYFKLVDEIIKMTNKITHERFILNYVFLCGGSVKFCPPER